MDAGKSADKFLHALKGVENWQEMGIAVAAQKVQRYVYTSLSDYKSEPWPELGYKSILRVVLVSRRTLTVIFYHKFGHFSFHHQYSLELS